MTEQEKQQINEDRREHRERLLEMLKEAGLFVKVTSESMSMLVVSDDVKVSHVDGKTQVIIKGENAEIDVSDALASVSVTFEPRNHPVFLLKFRRKAMLHGPPRLARKTG